MAEMKEEWEEEVYAFKKKYTIKILNIGKKMKNWEYGREIESSSFVVGSNWFSIIVFPNGDENETENSVVVRINNLNDYKVHINCEFEVGGLHASYPHVTIAKVDDEDYWGCQFTHDELKHCAVNRGSLVVAVTISLAWEENCEFIKYDVGTLKQDVGTLKQDSGTLKQDVGTLKQDVRGLMEMMRSMERSFRNVTMASKKSNVPSPECPICFEDLKPPTKILQCQLGHLICQNCRNKPEVLICPTCKREFMGRAFGMEEYMATLFG